MNPVSRYQIHAENNGPEYISGELINWANQQQSTLLYIQPGKPNQNACIERFNRTARHEWLDMHQFDSMEHAQLLATQWLWQYNNERPHSAIGGIPPRYLLKRLNLLLKPTVINGGITTGLWVRTLFMFTM